jgi:response regulator RpfG family c-di-GMP phosphodiesterase
MMTNEKVLCVDDDTMMLFALERDLRSKYAVVAATSGSQALSLLETKGPFAVLIADMAMPEMNGIEVLAQAQCISPETVRIMLTGTDDKQTAIDAINEGRIFRFLTKPCAAEKLLSAVDAAVKQYRLIVSERELLEKTLNGSVNMLTELLATTEPDAFGRGQQVSEYMKQVAPALEITSIWDLQFAAVLAQIGLVTLPPAVLQKLRAGIPLATAEQAMVTRVPEIGSKLIGKIPRLESAAQILLYQNKGFDGSGFPAGTPGGASIPLGARLLRVLSDLVELEAKGIPKKEALEQLRKKPQPYDPKVLAAVQKVIAGAGVRADGKAVGLKDLVAGCELVTAIETTDGMLIAPAGAILSDTMLERIRNFAELMGIREPFHVNFPPSK